MNYELIKTYLIADSNPDYLISEAKRIYSEETNVKIKYLGILVVVGGCVGTHKRIEIFKKIS
jgi:hypothetical protein